jgi:hypothetical protein
VELAGRLNSFEQAAVALAVTRQLQITGRHVQRLTQEVGAELAQQRDEQAQRQRRRQLPAEAAPPPVAVVEVDGGRIFTRQPGAVGVQDAEVKEAKVADLLGLDSPVQAADPQPEPPASFRDAPRIRRLVRRRQGRAGGSAEEPEPTAADEPVEAGAPPRPPRAERPERLRRTCVAAMGDSHAFGPLVAAAAQRRGFFEAARQAFVADGAHYNWDIHRGYFPHFVAIADFIHVLCYLYRAACAVQPDEAARWAQYEAWMAACWQGRAAEVQQELACWQGRLGRPPPGEGLAEEDPRVALADALCYLGNNAPRRDYPSYRRQGLPVTSSLMESLVGEFNARLKGRDKHWNRPEGAEAILQVRAAVLSEDGRLGRYFATRPGCPYRRRPRPQGSAPRRRCRAKRRT